jgi:DNA polymerase V
VKYGEWLPVSFINLKSNRIFALVDCNNFFASCERVFRPDLWDRPIVVLSNNDGNIIARSDESKALGIKMASPYFKVSTFLKKNGVEVFSSNYTLYGDMSHRVMSVLKHLESAVEVYSIDEAFISLPAGKKSNFTGHGQHIKAVVQKWTGLPVSIGFAHTKTLAKIANRIAKRNSQHKGVFDLTTYDNIDAILSRIEVKDVWGIGRQYTKKLNNHGIFTARDLKYSNDKWIKRNLTVMGLRTVWELRGKPCISIEDAPALKKGIITSKSFSHPVTSLEELKEAVATYVSRAAEKLRSQHSITNALHIFLSTNRFKPDSPQYSNSLLMVLPEPTASTPILIKHSLNSLEKIYRSGFEYKKAGVMLTEIMPEAYRQGNLFNQDRDDRNLMGALDSINAKWGQSTVQCAAAGFKKPWMFKREQLSKAYTTQWDQLPVVKASI